MRELDDSVVERNFAKESLTEAEIRTIVKAAGGVEAVLNTRHAIAKREGWKVTPPGLVDFIKGVAEHENVIRRPILVKNGKAVVGKDEAAMRALLNG